MLSLVLIALAIFLLHHIYPTLKVVAARYAIVGGLIHQKRASSSFSFLIQLVLIRHHELNINEAGGFKLALICTNVNRVN